VTHGLHDLVTPYFATRMMLDHRVAVPRLQARIRFETFPGGHMFYARDASRRAFRDGGRRLIEGRPMVAP
jgi:carboxypeptidase C (cathepsin A)